MRFLQDESKSAPAWVVAIRWLNVALVLWAFCSNVASGHWVPWPPVVIILAAAIGWFVAVNCTPELRLYSLVRRPVPALISLVLLGWWFVTSCGPITTDRIFGQVEYVQGERTTINGGELWQLWPFSEKVTEVQMSGGLSINPIDLQGRYLTQDSVAIGYQLGSFGWKVAESEADVLAAADYLNAGGKIFGAFEAALSTQASMMVSSFSADRLFPPYVIGGDTIKPLDLYIELPGSSLASAMPQWLTPNNYRFYLKRLDVDR